MGTGTVQTVPMSRGDRISLWGFVGAGVVIIAATAVTSVARVVEVLRGGAIPVMMHFQGVTTNVPLGDRAVPAALESATVTVDGLPAASVIAAVAQPLLVLIATATVVACLILLAMNCLRGQVFSRASTVEIAVAVAAAIAGFALSPLLEGMIANGAAARLGGAHVEGVVVLSVQPMLFLVGVFAAAVIGTAFTVGARLQRDQEGLA